MKSLQIPNTSCRRMIYNIYTGTVKPVLRGHLWDKEKMAL